MDLSLRTMRFRLQAAGLLPTSRVARAACYLLGLDLLLFALQRFLGLLKLSYGQALSGWVGILSFLALVLLGLLAFRWLKARLLWRLRNRLIVTYVFIGGAAGAWPARHGGVAGRVKAERPGVGVAQDLRLERQRASRPV